jgi:peptidase E
VSKNGSFLKIIKKIILMYILPCFHPTIHLKYIQQFTKNGQIKVTYIPFAKQQLIYSQKRYEKKSVYNVET